MTSVLIRSGLASVMTLLVLLTSGQAPAELISFDLLSPNAAIGAYQAPFANVSINRTDTTHATVMVHTYATG